MLGLPCARWAARYWRIVSARSGMAIFKCSQLAGWLYIHYLTIIKPHWVDNGWIMVIYSLGQEHNSKATLTSSIPRWDQGPEVEHRHFQATAEAIDRRA